MLKTCLLSIPKEIRPVVVLNEDFVNESSVTLIDSVSHIDWIIIR